MCLWGSPQEVLHFSQRKFLRILLYLFLVFSACVWIYSCVCKYVVMCASLEARGRCHVTSSTACPLIKL